MSLYLFIDIKIYFNGINIKHGVSTKINLISVHNENLRLTVYTKRIKRLITINN